MSYFILRENIKRIDILLIICALIGVLIMSKGFDTKTEKEEAKATANNAYIPLVAVIGLISLPINDSYGNILQRKLRELHYMTLFLYLNSLFLLMLSVQFIWLDLDFVIFNEFSFFDWVIVLFFSYSSFLI